MSLKIPISVRFRDSFISKSLWVDGHCSIEKLNPQQL